MHRTSAGRLAVLVAVFVLLVAACGDDGDGVEADASTTTAEADASTTTAPDVPSGPVAPLTGMPIDDESILDNPAMVVKISNNDDKSLAALIGIEQADVVIEERIEDRATRFATIFHSQLPELVGPVRSGRTTDLDLLAPLNVPILAFSGAQGAVLSQLNGLQNDGKVVLVVDRGTGVDLFRDDDYRRPDNLFTNLPDLLEKYGDQAGTAVPLFSYDEPGTDGPAGGVDGEGVTVRGRDVVSFVWDESRGYVRVQDGVVHVTREGTPIVVDNVVVMETDYTPSRLVNGSVDAHTTGLGTVSILRGGERLDGIWGRATPDDAFTFADADGEAITLAPGTTWVTLVPRDTYDFTVDAETSALVLGDGQ